MDLNQYIPLRSHNNEYEEEYIDLNPILENLYIPSNEFLSKIKEVRIQNT